MTPTQSEAWKAMVGALEFYANKKNLSLTAWIEQHGPDAGKEHSKILVTDKGEVAKKALDLAKKVEGV